MKKYANLYPGRPGGPWIAFLKIPADVQHIVKGTNGKPWFQVSTGERNQAKAHAMAAPMLAEWRRRIDEARRTNQDPLQVELQRLQKLYGEAVKTGDGGDLFAGIIQFLSDRAMPPIDMMLHGSAAIETSSTPFLTHIEAWKAADRYSGQQLKTALAHINAFGACAPAIEKLSSDHIQVWVDQCLANGDSENTVRNRLYSNKNYWTWMSGRGLAPKATPFIGIEIKSASAKAKKATTKPKRFEPEDVVRLWTEAKNDHPLYAMIMIAAYSGARREAIARLKISDVHLDAAVPYFHVVKDKTEAGDDRNVPVHSAIHDLVRELVRNADADGFLIHTGAKGERRGDAIGKRFSKMKTKMGFDGRRDFHSLRRTAIYLFVKNGTPLNVIKNIVGHVDTDITTGTYAGVVDLVVMHDAMEKSLRY